MISRTRKQFPLTRATFVLTCLIVYAGLGVRTSWADDTDYAPPAGYYDSAAGLTGSALQSQLATIMSTGFHGRSYGDYRYASAVLDADPNHAGNILLLYNRASVSSAWDLGTTWNREHQWPVSLLGTGDPRNSTINMETDEFFLRPSNPAINSSRGNSPYGTATSSGANGYQTPGYVASHRPLSHLFQQARRSSLSSDITWPYYRQIGTGSEQLISSN